MKLDPHHCGVVCLLIFALAACGKSATTPGQGEAGAGAAAGTPSVVEGGSGAAMGGAGSGDQGGAGAGVGGTGGHSGGTIGAGGVGGAEGGTSQGGAPSDEPSKQSVTFHVVNDAGAPRAVVVGGVGCTAFTIVRKQPAGVVWTAVANACGPCSQCPNPPTGTKRIALIAQGESVDLAWDAREVRVYQESAMCKGGVPTPYQHVVTQPVAAGAYRVRVGVFATPPGSCNATGMCDPPVKTTQAALPYAALCDASAQVDADFELPPDQDITVPVTLH